MTRAFRPRPRNVLPVLRAVALAALSGASPASALCTDRVSPECFDTSQIRSVLGPTLMSDGRWAEIFENLAYTCAQPDCWDDPAGGCTETPGKHEFLVVYPLGHDPANPPLEAEPFDLYAGFRGGGVGWLDDEGLFAPSPSPGRDPWIGFRPIPKHSFNRAYLQYMSDLTVDREANVYGVIDPRRHSLAARFRRDYPDWALYFPSYCSVDGYQGVGDSFNSGIVRFGWSAAISGLKHVETNHGIHEVVTAGLSAGGFGAFDLGRFGPTIFGSSEFVGVVMADSAFEPDIVEHFFPQFEPLPQPGGYDCGSDMAPTYNEDDDAYDAFSRSGIDGRSASADVLSGAMSLPLAYVFNARDQTLCARDDNTMATHGLMVSAIDTMDPGGKSFYRQVCAEYDSCSVPGLELDAYLEFQSWPSCNKHGTIGSESANVSSGSTSTQGSVDDAPMGSSHPMPGRALFADDSDIVHDLLEWIAFVRTGQVPSPAGPPNDPCPDP